jgi:hypothetical protein
MVPQETDGRIVQLAGRKAYRPDLGALAREQVAQARLALGLTPAEFAEMLGPLLGWSPTAETVESWETNAVPPGDVMVAAELATASRPRAAGDRRSDVVDRLTAERYADVTEVYGTRSEFSASLPPDRLLDGATHVRAMGLSLNLLCQHYSDRQWQTLVEEGAKVQALFLEPSGDSIQAREREEGFPRGHLSALTALNIQTLIRVRKRLPEEFQSAIEIATYDRTLRFNLLFVDDEICVAQPYLVDARGIDSPTFIIKRRWPTAGLYPLFEHAFKSTWAGAQHL